VKRLLVVLIALSLVLALAGCQTPPTTTSTTNANTVKYGAKKDTSEQLYIAVMFLSSLDFFKDHMDGLKKAGEDFGVKVEYTGPTDASIEAMTAAFESAIAKKPNGIITIGIEEMAAEIQKATAAGIPVVTVEGDLPPDKIKESGRVCYVGTANKGAGVVGGQYLASILGGKGKVAVLTNIPAFSLEERLAGYKEAFAAFPDIQIVEIMDDDDDPVKAAQMAATALQKHPDLAGFACLEAAGGAGAATAIKEAGLAGKVKVIGMDRGNDLLKFIEEGIITASVAQQTALLPYYALSVLYNINNAQPLMISTNDKAARVPGVPAFIDTGTVIITKDNYIYFVR
jgi:ribose transport system substrate-binding protein